MSDEEQHILADTNLFFECHKLPNLPWKEIGSGTIIIIVTKPVLDEIDKHKKKASGRTKGRALDIWQKIRTMFDAGETEYVVQNMGPKVIFRMVSLMPYDKDIEDHLDMSKPDDKLISILSKAHKDNDKESLCLLTHDTGPASTAQSMGLPVKLIPESWLRPHPLSEESKRIKELQQTVSKYKSQEPHFSISAYHQGEKIDQIKIVRKVRKALTAKEIDDFIEEIKRRAPIKTDFDKRGEIKGIKFAAIEDQYDIEHIAPDPEAIKTYQTEAYPEWIEECRTVLAKLHEIEEPYKRKLPLRFIVNNNGTRPAEHARIEFVTKGNVYITRDRPSDEDDHENEDYEAQPSIAAAPLPKLPKAPVAPKWTAKRTLKSKPTAAIANSPTSMLQASAAMNAVTRAHDFSGLNSVMKSLQVSGFEHLIKQQKLHETMFGKSAIGNFHLHNQGMISNQIPISIPKLYSPPKHDKEKFYYYEWSPEIPLGYGALKVDLWRHSTGDEAFEMNLHFDNETETSAMIECRIHASNLTEPAELRIPVSLQIETTKVTELAKKIIDDCAPLLFGKIYAANLKDGLDVSDNPDDMN